MIVFSIFLIAIGTIFLAVKNRKDLKTLKVSSLIVIGTILVSIGTWLKDIESRKQSKKTDENGVALIEFETRLDSILAKSADSEIQYGIEKLKVDYENWADGIATNLQIREFANQQRIAKEKADQLSKRKPLIEDFNAFITSVKNYSNAYNKVSRDTISYDFSGIDGLTDESFGMVRGSQNTYFLTFEFTNRFQNQEKGEIRFHTVSNPKFDEFIESISQTDTLKFAMNYLAFKLKLITHINVGLKFDSNNEKIQVNEYNDNWRNEIFENSYDLGKNSRQTIDFLAKKLIEEILYIEKTKANKRSNSIS